MKYVCGFMFDEELSNVALIKKNKPEWQKGKFNGIGGKIEDSETSLEAMVREFEEETGCKTDPSRWVNFHACRGANWRVEFYYIIGDPDSLESKEDEKVYAVSLGLIRRGNKELIENLCWLIPLALDQVDDGRPFYGSTEYPD